MNCTPVRIKETSSFLLKSPGSDKIPNYKRTVFPATHSYITEFSNTIIEEPKQMPDWLTM